MKTVLLSAAVSLFCALFGTPIAIKVFTRRGYGQEIRADGPAGHLSKRGTPTMGGTVIIVASLSGYLVGHLVTGDADVPVRPARAVPDDRPRPGRLRRRLHQAVHAAQPGPAQRGKLAGQAVVGGIFAVLAVKFPDGMDLTPASTHLSFYADFGISIGPVLFVVWVIFMVSGDLQRGESHRRAGRPGHRRGHPRAGRLRDHRDLAAAQRCTVYLAAELLRRARPAGPRRRRGHGHGRLLRVPVVERAAGQDLHGRHRVAGPGRRAGRPGHPPAPSCCCSCSAACS